MTRENELKQWIEGIYPGVADTLTVASADASFRSYYRITLPDQSTRVVMDAPPALEDSRPFVDIASRLHKAGVHAPVVEHADLSLGFMVLSDLGNIHYQDVLSLETARPLYEDAFAALIRMQAIDPVGLPAFDEAHMRKEMDIFDEWYVGVHLKATLNEQQTKWLAEVKAALVDNLAHQTQVFMHRDYHCRNLMYSTTDNPAVIDFQGAMRGPVSYDLASLLKDAYISWEEEQVLDWAIRYWSAARKAGVGVPDDFDHFYRDFEWAGVQRHLKIVGLFARLNHRDGKARYLDDLPLILTYLTKTCRRYRPLAPVARIIDDLQGQQAQVGYTF